MVNDEDKTIKIGWVSVWRAFGNYSNATAVLGLLRSEQDRAMAVTLQRE